MLKDSMQYRVAERFSAVFKVMLYHQNRPIADCYTENISCDGIFINAGSTVFPRSTTVEIEFEVDSNDKRETFRIPASIIHSTNNGLGMKFAIPNTEDEILSHAMLGYISRTHQT